ncbi:cell separation during budding [Tieghemiomyces parasiticus]|uniref:Cell separation during budding n=1 Tax=Tieghemiomyces parasiticus TaxID=78921 RepID=A0A9W8AFN0_9FUNG|nr:cell separation during budding [Tieghemiomyces parasiticus]
MDPTYSDTSAGSSPKSPSQDWTLIPAKQLVQHQQVIEIDSELPIEDACQILIEKGISSAPIYDSHAQAYIGMFDYRDLITYLLIVLNRTGIPPPQQTLEVKTLIRKAAQMQQVPVRLASDLSTQNPFYSIVPDTTLSHVVAIFGYGTHRMAVVSDDGQRIEGIISQSTVIKFLDQNLDRFTPLRELAAQSLQDLKLAETAVFTVNADSMVMDAMKAMVDYGVTSLAVVDSDESAGLLGNISLTDIKYVMKKRQHQFLWRTCLELIRYAHIEQGTIDGEDKATVFCVSPNSSLRHSIALLAATRAHRLWVTVNTGGSSPTTSPTHGGGGSNNNNKSSSNSNHLAGTASTSHTGTTPPTTIPVATSPPGATVRHGLTKSHSHSVATALHLPIADTTAPTLPLTTSGRVVGIVSLTDILRVLTPSD